MFEIINTVIYNFWTKVVDFLPDLFSGLLILAIGIIIASLLKRILMTIFMFIKLDILLQKTKLISKSEVKIWEEVLVEILKWTVVIIFLVPTLEVWGLSKANGVINQIIIYLPNVIIAVIIGFVGLVISNLSSDLTKQSLKTFGEGTARTLSMMAKSMVIFFTSLIVLNQLGVAQDLIRILFTGIILMLAMAGGLAFGLGGKDIAKEALEKLKEKLK